MATPVQTFINASADVFWMMKEINVLFSRFSERWACRALTTSLHLQGLDNEIVHTVPRLPAARSRKNEEFPHSFLICLLLHPANFHHNNALLQRWYLTYVYILMVAFQSHFYHFMTTLWMLKALKSPLFIYIYFYAISSILGRKVLDIIKIELN